MHKPDEADVWYAPKRTGYGAGLPVKWQGWAVIAAYLAALIPLHWLRRLPGAGPRIAAFVLFMVCTAVFLRVVMTHTRGGWKWRWKGRA